MELPSQDKERIQHQFDAFCRTTLKYAARNMYRQRTWRAQHEVSLSELPEPKFYHTDDYNLGQHKFSVLDFDISIKNELLAEALAMLPEDKRRIVLLAYFLDMNDREIGELLNLVRTTVQYQRTSSLKKLKQILEELRSEEE